VVPCCWLECVAVATLLGAVCKYWQVQDELTIVLRAGWATWHIVTDRGLLFGRSCDRVSRWGRHCCPAIFRCFSACASRHHRACGGVVGSGPSARMKLCCPLRALPCPAPCVGRGGRGLAQHLDGSSSSYSHEGPEAVWVHEASQEVAASSAAGAIVLACSMCGARLGRWGQHSWLLGVV
jgi:hypothetical protein